MPIGRLFEQQCKIFKVLIPDIRLQRSFSDFHQAVNILQHLERFLPQAKFNGGFKLFQPDFDISVINICFLDIDIDVSLQFSSFSFVHDSFECFLEGFAEGFELVFAVVLVDKVEYFEQGLLEDLLEFLVYPHSLDYVLVTLPHYLQLVSQLLHLLLLGGFEAGEYDR